MERLHPRRHGERAPNRSICARSSHFVLHRPGAGSGARALALVLALAACGPGGSTNDDGSGGAGATGGSPGSGGASSTGGRSASGGASGSETGGSGTPPTGSGGRATTAGSGGATTAGTGGASGSGGVAAGSGGAATAGKGGGEPASGGAGGGRGGASATGGRAAGTGGSGSGGMAAGGAGSGGGGKAGGPGGATAGSGGSGSGGATAGSGGATSPGNTCKWPTPTSTEPVTATISVSGSYDGGMKRFVGSGALGTSGQSEDQDPLFNLKSGATLQNVILGNPAADGVHCEGACTLKNVWWEDVGEDAATFRGSSASQTMTVDGGGAAHASDKVFQHNGAGTLTIKNFCAQDIGKLYRSCGNCSTQYERHLVVQNVVVTPPAKTLAGVNTNYNDSATFAQITIKGKTDSVDVCDRYTGNDSGDEPPKTGSGPDGKACKYAASDITWSP